MNITDLLKEDSIILNEHSNNKEEAINKLVDRHFICQHITNKKSFKKAILKREELSSTGVGNLIAIPHAQDDSVCYPALVAMVDKDGVDFQSLDHQPTKVFFMIAVPKEGGNQHLEILAQLSRILMDEKIVKSLLNAQTPKHFLDILNSRIIDKEEVEKKQSIDIIAVTACPTGIAHTYMAAKALEEAAKKKGVHIKIETNGASGIKNKLTQEDIIQAKCVIIAADKKVEIERFAHKHLIQVPVTKGIHDAEELIEKAMKQETEIYKEKFKDPIKNETKTKKRKSIKKIYNHLMNGISQIIPLLMIYGVFTKIASMMPNQMEVSYAEQLPFLSSLEGFANMALLLSLSILSAFIADSISDRPGFVVALVISSAFSLTGQLNVLETILIGFVAGYLVLGIKKLCTFLPDAIQSIVPNLILPIICSLIMIFIMRSTSLQISNYLLIFNNIQMNVFISIIIGLLLGGMMSIDMGGPINKIAYTIGIISIFMNNVTIMSAVMIGGMIPPLVIGVSMLIAPSLFDDTEKNGKWGCLIKGLCFVSEEAIPYMKKDKKGIHLPCIIASAIGGALSMYFECGQRFPHGGIFTLLLIDQPIFFVISLVAATLIGTSLILLLKKPVK